MKKGIVCRFCVIAFIGILPAGAVVAADDQPQNSRVLAEMRENYKKAPAPPKFIPLPAGAVKPAGWLRDWAEASAEGIVGQLKDRSDTFRYGWTGQDFKAKGEEGRGLRWPLEQSAYWLDGLVRLAYILDDQELKDLAHSRLDKVVDGVNNGGESFIWWEARKVLQVKGDDLPFTTYTRNFNNWAHAHMGRALVAYYQSTGKPEILKALAAAYADFPLAELPKGEFYPHGSATNLDPMLVTYAMSGDKRVLDNATSFAQSAAFKELVKAWNTEELPDGHTVLYYEHVRVPAVTYPWTGDKKALEATARMLDLGLERHGLPAGMASGQEHLMGTGAIRGLETCTVAASSWSYKWMLQLTGERKYADQMEQILLNAGPASVSRDFDLACYFQTMNRIDKVVPIHTVKTEGYDYSKTAGPTLCCVGNITRMIPDYVQHMWMATMDGGLAATLYGPAQLDSIVGDGTSVTLVSETDYPFNDKISVKVLTASSANFPLYIRIPGWTKTAEVRVNDTAINVQDQQHGFVKIAREWKSGDVIRLTFPMAPEIRRGTTTAVPKTKYFKQPLRALPITKVKNDGFPFASVHYGPLLFALPIPDMDPNEALPDAKWNYAIDASLPDGSVKVERTSVPGDFHWQLDAPLKLQIAARASTGSRQILSLYPRSRLVTGRVKPSRWCPTERLSSA